MNESGTKIFKKIKVLLQNFRNIRKRGGQFTELAGELGKNVSKGGNNLEDFFSHKISSFQSF